MSLAGFITEEELDVAGTRVGFRSLDVRDPSKTVQLASITGDDDSHAPRVGPFTVHVGGVTAFLSNATSFDAVNDSDSLSGEAGEYGDSSSVEKLSHGEVMLHVRPKLRVLDEVGAMQCLCPGVQALLEDVLRLSHDHTEAGAQPSACGASPAPSSEPCGGGQSMSPSSVPSDALYAPSPKLGTAISNMYGRVVPCLGSIPPLGLHDLTFVDALRCRSDVLVVEVTIENRVSLVEKVWRMLWPLLYTPSVVDEINTKAVLATRYVGELSTRLEGSICRDGGVRFRGDHGCYKIQSPAGGLLPRRCSCPFFGCTGTCSHTLALVLCEEA